MARRRPSVRHDRPRRRGTKSPTHPGTPASRARRTEMPAKEKMKATATSGLYAIATTRPNAPHAPPTPRQPDAFAMPHRSRGKITMLTMNSRDRKTLRVEVIRECEHGRRLSENGGHDP